MSERAFSNGERINQRESLVEAYKTLAGDGNVDPESDDFMDDPRAKFLTDRLMEWYQGERERAGTDEEQKGLAYLSQATILLDAGFRNKNFLNILAQALKNNHIKPFPGAKFNAKLEEVRTRLDDLLNETE